MNIGKLSAVATLALASVLAGVSPALAIDDPSVQIIGGHDATEPYPFMAALRVPQPDGRIAFCGATLRTSRWAVTAAHCVSDDTVAPLPVPLPVPGMTLRIGSPDRTTGGVLAGVTRVVLHPWWVWGADPTRPISDLAMLELDQPVPLPGIRPALQAASDVRLLGWGLTAIPPPPGTTIPVTLQEVDTHRLPAQRCAAGFIGTGEVCLGGRDGAIGACFGDSGGPALQRSDSRWRQVGVASREAGDAGCGIAVYTDLSYRPFQGWMLLTMLKMFPIGPPRIGPPTPPVATTAGTAPTRRHLRWR